MLTPLFSNILFDSENDAESFTESLAWSDK